MVRRGLLLRRDTFTQRQNLCHDRLDLSRVDQMRDLGEVFGIRVNGDSCSTSTSACHAVNAPIGTAAASVKLSDAGFAATSPSVTVSYSAQPPPKVG